MIGHLKFKKDPKVDPASVNKEISERITAMADKKKKVEKKEELSYDQIAFALKSQVKQAPVKTEDQMTDKEKALARKKKLLELQE